MSDFAVMAKGKQRMWLARRKGTHDIVDKKQEMLTENNLWLDRSDGLTDSVFKSKHRDSMRYNTSPRCHRHAGRVTNVH